MEDERIIDLFWERDESAITETSSKYGKLCFYIANNILTSKEDSEEVVNDTYMTLWNCIPTNRPNRLAVFIGKIARNLSLKKYEYNSAAKRNPEAACSIDELEEIFNMNCKKYDYKVAEDVQHQVRALITAKKIENIDNFANAREVRNLFEEIITNQARRISTLENPTEEDMMTIVLEDLSDTVAKPEEDKKEENDSAESVQE